MPAAAAWGVRAGAGLAGRSDGVEVRLFSERRGLAGAGCTSGWLGLLARVSEMRDRAGGATAGGVGESERGMEMRRGGTITPSSGARGKGPAKEEEHESARD